MLPGFTEKALNDIKIVSFQTVFYSFVSRYNLGGLKIPLKTLLDPSIDQILTGLIMLLVLKSDACSVFFSSVSFLFATFMFVLVSLGLGLPSSFLEEWDVGLCTTDPLSCITISSMLRLSSTTQICSGGTAQGFCPRILQYLMLIASGELDNNPSTINTTRTVTDTDSEDLDTSSGMVP